ncbi:WYL domain-containing protein [Actinomadura madurae]|uniref:WYL domain-containing protein n=1 Tax=Actinomadura madurae TaxID=1993 RepID=UPI0027E248F5|nr:WYL domain-containing protein [Actinomadura madurae]
MVGFDRDRDEQRVFRLSRIVGEVAADGPAGSVTVPDGVDVRRIAFDWGDPVSEPRPAAVRLRRGAAQGTRRWARDVRPVDDPEWDGEWDEAVLTFRDVDRFAPYLARFAGDVVVLDPPDLREAVIQHLKSVLAAARRAPGGRSRGPGGDERPMTAKAAAKTAATTSTDRLGRLLALVPYVVNRDSVALGEAAAAFGVTEKQLIDDLNLLWCVELRAPDPYCPIDLSYEGGEITVAEAESIARPLRLKVDEASALLVALRMLAGIPGLDDRDALSRVIAKLESAAGAAAAVSSQVAVEVDTYGGTADPARTAVGVLRDAIAAAAAST